MALISADPGGPVRVSIVMPARNAAPTIAESLDSVIHQTFRSWELIVVDDGSNDDTAAIVDARAARDRRIRRISQPCGGVSCARNVGTAAARHAWTLYLDADDWLAATHLERMTAVLDADPSLDAVHCGSVRIAPDGTRVDEQQCPATGDLFEPFTRFCAFPVHACVFRRSLVDAVNGWDPSLSTCEDWDFWLRVARTPARFGAVRECLALYRMRPGSSSLDGFRYLADGLRVLPRAYRRDPRVRHPDPAHAAGAPRSGLSNAVFSFVCWPAGLVLGAGADARPLLDSLEVGGHRTLDPGHVAGSLLTSALLPGAHLPSDWPALWPSLEDRLGTFLGALEERSGASGLARRARLLMERNIAERSAPRSFARVGGLQSMEIEITQPLSDLMMPPGVERLRCMVTLEGDHLGAIHLPVCDRTVSRALLGDAIAHELSWIILGTFFARTVYRDLGLAAGAHGRAMARGLIPLIQDVPAAALPDQLHARVGWLVFLQELWGRPRWPLSAFYAGTLHDSGGVVHAGTGRVTIEISEELPDLASEGDVDVQMGGVSLGWMTVPALTRCQLRMRIIRAVGRDLYRVAVREALLGAPLIGGGTLRERLRNAAEATRRARAAGPPSSAEAAMHALQHTGGVVLARRGQGAAGTSASRRATFPRMAAEDLVEAAETRGDPVIRVPVNGPAPRVVYAPDIITAGSAPLTTPSDLKSIAHDSPPCGPQLPILMYHRVAAPASAIPPAISPAAFEAQLRYLRDAGASSVTLGEWRVAWENRLPFRGRSVLITFDDGYRDFAEAAWPLLKRYGFSALLFVVTGEVGGTNRWDTRQHGAPALPLLGWDDLRRLRDEGLEVGSHSVSHPYLTGLSHVEVIREATRSQMALERELGRPAAAFSYPYGDVDEYVQHWIGACGYTFGLTCRPGPATHHDRLLALPRIEVTKDDTPGSLAGKLGF